jgi:hypothetical protein
MRAFRAAGALAVQHIRDAAVSIEGGSEEATKDVLRKCAATTLNSKLVRCARSGLPPVAACMRYRRPPHALRQHACMLRHAEV